MWGELEAMTHGQTFGFRFCEKIDHAQEGAQILREDAFDHLLLFLVEHLPIQFFPDALLKGISRIITVLDGAADALDVFLEVERFAVAFVDVFPP